MNRAIQHLASRAGTSFTKAVRTCCAAMRPAAAIQQQWNKHAGAGFTA
jgi:hypothetical protein